MSEETNLPVEEPPDPGVAARRPPPAAKQQPQPRQEPTSKSAERISEEDDKDVWTFLNDLGGEAALQIKLYRKQPKDWQGHHIAGYIEEFDEVFTEQDIIRRFGGGKYQVKTWRHNPKGGWQYSGAKTFEIAGDPKITGLLPEDNGKHNNSRNTDDGDVMLQAKAMDHMQRLANDSQKRSWALEDETRRQNQNQNRGTDPELLRLLTDNPQVRMMQTQLASFQQALADKDKQLLDIVSRKPETTVMDRITEKMVDGESARIEGIRLQHESERRQLLDSHRQDIERERSRLEGELTQRERSHEREIGTLRESQGFAQKSIEQSYEARVDGLKGRIADLERQLAKTEAELTEQRNKKDKGPLDSVEEVAKLKNALEVLSPNEKEPSSIWEKVLDTVMNSPLAGAVAARVENAPPAQPQPMHPQEIRRRRAAQAMAQAQGGQGGVPTAPKKKPKPTGPPALNPIEVAAAIQFMENALVNGTDPVQFAASARAMVPAQVLHSLREMGPDRFLDLARVPEGSQLLTQAGRNFVRKIARALLGYGGAEGAPVEPMAAETPTAPAEAPETPTAEDDIPF